MTLPQELKVKIHAAATASSSIWTASSTGDESEDERPSLPPNPLTLEGLAKQPHLRMLHHSLINWTASPLPTSWLGGVVNPTHLLSQEVYSHGGSVFRVNMAISKNQQTKGKFFAREDVMVCDVEYCLHCNADADDELEPQSDGLPFVHALDTIRREGITFFVPKPRPYELDYGQKGSYLRRIRLMAEGGEMSVPARVCTALECYSCNARMNAMFTSLVGELGIDVPDGKEPKQDVEAGFADERTRKVTFAPGTPFADSAIGGPEAGAGGTQEAGGKGGDELNKEVVGGVRQASDSKPSGSKSRLRLIVRKPEGIAKVASSRHSQKTQRQ